MLRLFVGDTMKRLSSLFNGFLSQRDPDGTRFHLSRLWKHWAQVVGDHIAGLARPLGHKGTTLIIGTEDHMIAQELTMYSPAILAQANEFLGMNFFDKVRVDLLGDHVSLDTLPEIAPAAQPLKPRRPDKLGDLAGKLDPDSPIARCYEAYIRSFEENGDNREGGVERQNKKFPKED